MTEGLAQPKLPEESGRPERMVWLAEPKLFTDHIIRNKKTIYAPTDVLGPMKKLWIEFVALSEDDKPSQSWLGVPMLVGNRLLGVIAVQSTDTPNLYDIQDRDILITIAGQAAIAVENARIFQESKRRAQEMSALAEVGREVSASLNLRTVLEKIAEYAIILLDSVTSAVYLPDPEFKILIPFAVTGDEAKEIKNDPLIIGTGILGNIAKSGAGEIVNNVYQDTRASATRGSERLLRHKRAAQSARALRERRPIRTFFVSAGPRLEPFVEGTRKGRRP